MKGYELPLLRRREFNFGLIAAPLALAALTFLLSSAACAAPLQITAGGVLVVDANGEQGAISGNGFQFSWPNTVDADFGAFGLPGTTIGLSGWIIIPGDIYYENNCSPVFGPSQGTYDGITAACVTGGLNYSGSALVSADGSSATGTFTATGEVQGWSEAPDGETFNQLFDVQLYGSGTVGLSECEECNHFDALSLGFSNPPAPEPSALLLLPTGLVAVFLLKRRPATSTP